MQDLNEVLFQLLDQHARAVRSMTDEQDDVDYKMGVVNGLMLAISGVRTLIEIRDEEYATTMEEAA